METISIQGPESIAKAYSLADKDTKRKTEILLNIHLNQIFNPLDPQKRLLDILDKGASEAKANGLTDAQLDELLKDE